MAWIIRFYRGRKAGEAHPAVVVKHVKWGRHQQRSAAELVADAEAFLNGRLVERGDFLGRFIPAWEWTNLLAHGSNGDLETESRGAWSRWDGTVAVRWRRARSLLAREVLEYAPAYGSLAEVQRSVLVPLELELASSPEVSSWMPSRWVQAVETALAGHNVGNYW